MAADTVGIRVLANRYRNVILAGLIAGIGGAYFTIGSVGSFGPDMSSGEGYIALAAMIFGRYTPFGAIGAALLFGFTTQLQSVLSSINVPIQSNLLLLTPYVVTIVVVAAWSARCAAPAQKASPSSSPEIHNRFSERTLAPPPAFSVSAGDGWPSPGMGPARSAPPRPARPPARAGPARPDDPGGPGGPRR